MEVDVAGKIIYFYGPSIPWLCNSHNQWVPSKNPTKPVMPLKMGFNPPATNINHHQQPGGPAATIAKLVYNYNNQGLWQLYHVITIVYYSQMGFETSKHNQGGTALQDVLDISTVRSISIHRIVHLVLTQLYIHIVQLWPFTSYNWLFLWDYTLYKWGVVSTYN